LGGSTGALWLNRLDRRFRYGFTMQAIPHTVAARPVRETQPLADFAQGKSANSLLLD